MKRYELIMECTPKGRVRYFGYTGYKYLSDDDLNFFKLDIQRAEEQEREKFEPKKEVNSELEDAFLRLVQEFTEKEMAEIEANADDATADEMPEIDANTDDTTDEDKVEADTEDDALEIAKPKVKKGAKKKQPSAQERLDKMVGLQRVKKEIEQMKVMVQFNLCRKQLKLSTESDGRYHMVFTGNPGTGKTTVAKLIGEIYRDMGVLSSGHVIVTERAKLVGEYIGQTELKTREEIDCARGGILFIDEAYTLMNTTKKDSNDFGKEVLNTLLTVLSEPDPNLIIVLAGYEDKMKTLFEYNPGLRDRFPVQLHFEDYEADELMQITHNLLKEREFELSPEADERLRELVESAVADKDVNFGNGRWVHNLVEHHVLMNMAQRVMSSPYNPNDRRLFTMIEECDIEAAAEEVLVGKSVVELPRRIGFTA